ncbi:hypothetical protein [Streptomyces sp. CMB-StM0423]|uniref:hypothetical protein n=1 Tax=Streptomyces sp. CMB-StM0423 TaxID=2059884 RepID=UPI000C711313|nr:hypothetical protein [Streptomyces sp. CMB-StM0423]AUH40543.1 hypothetical protein CXR04_10045 [Streptomyces sp. CMB-StM0423]
MTTSDLTHHMAQLHTMSRDFAELGTQVREVECAPGTDALRAISPLVIKGHQLADAVLTHLNALDAGSITKVAGSRDALHGIATVVSSAAVAVQDLTSALAANDFTGQESPGVPEPTDSIRAHRRSTAAKELSGHMTDAAHQLDLTGILCMYVAGTMKSHLAEAQAPTATPTPQIPAEKRASSPGRR